MRLTDLTYSLKTLRAAKSRTLLTMLGVIIGVMSVIAISSVGKSAENLIINQVTQFGTNLIGIIPGSSQENEPPPIAYGIVTTTFKFADYEAVRDLPHVVAGSPYVQSIEAVSLGERAAMINISGTGHELLTLEDAELAEGRFFTERDVASYSRLAVLGHEAAERLSPHDDPIGKQIRIKGHSFQVIGVMEERGSAFFQNLDDLVIIPVTTAQRVIAGINYLNFARLKVGEAKYLDRVKDDVERTLRHRHHIKDPDKDDFSVRASDTAVDMLSNVTGTINIFLIMVTAISLIVGGINIMNIMYVAVRERTREIGLRKALGARPRRILTQFLIESSFISFLGGFIGLVLGLLIAVVASYVVRGYGLDWSFAVSGVSIFYGLGVSIGIGLVFGVQPARAAANLDAIEALRYE